MGLAFTSSGRGQVTMTDIGNWPDLIKRDGQYSEYIMLPFNEYQMGNIVDALSQVQENGDWWGEFLNIVHATMDKFGIQELRSNNGRTFTKDQIWSRNIRPEHEVVSHPEDGSWHCLTCGESAGKSHDPA